MVKCPKCKRKLRNGAKFCDYCGTSVNNLPASVGTHSAPSNGTLSSLLSFFSLNISTKSFKSVVSAIAVVLVFIILISVIVPNSENNAFAYIKDNELYYSTVSKSKGKQATTDMLNNVSSVGNIEELVRLSSDGKRLFFVDKYDGSGYDLYYKKTSSMKKESEKITSNIKFYDINDKGTLVTYIKDGGKLYQHDLKEQSNKIDEDILTFIASDDGKSILYIKVQAGSDTYALDVYQSESGKTGEKVLSGAESIKYLSKDLKTIYYVSGSALYKVKVGKEPQKISDGIGEVINVYDSGVAYFSKDAGNGTYSLFYYDGKKELTAIADNFHGTVTFAEDYPVLFFHAGNDDNDLTNKSHFLAVKDNVSKLEYDVSSIYVDPDGDNIFFITNFDSQKGTGKLYKAKLTGNGLKSADEVDTEVCSGSFIAEDKYLYVKNYDGSDSTGDVYLNGKLVGEDIYWNYVNYSAEKDTLVYFTDVDESSMAALNVFKGNKSKKILDDVYMYSLSIAPNGELLFIGGFDNGVGTLYVCKNKKAKMIDEKVSSVIRFSTNEEYDDKIIANF